MDPGARITSGIRRGIGLVRQALWRLEVGFEMLYVREGDPYVRRVGAIHRRLGVPRDYARRGLPFQREAAHLVPVPCDGGETRHLMTPVTRARFVAMRAAAAEAGVTLRIRWAFRSIDDQAHLIRRQLRGGAAIEDTLHWVAAPGYSEHHTGRALDFARIPNQARFEDTLAFEWLCRNAERFAFHMSYPRDNPQGIVYEPWHWYCHAPEEGG